MNGGTDRLEMERMQRDAENRMREMQRRSDRAVSGSSMPPVPNFVRTNPMRRPDNFRQPTPPKNEDNLKQSKTPPRNENDKGAAKGKGKGFNLLSMLNFKGIKFDSDTILIIALIFLLSTEETDELLLLALVYIML